MYTVSMLESQSQSCRIRNVKAEYEQCENQQTETDCSCSLQRSFRSFVADRKITEEMDWSDIKMCLHWCSHTSQT